MFKRWCYFFPNNFEICAVKKILYNSCETRNEKIVNLVNNVLIYLRNGVNRNEIPKNENPGKVIDIVEEILKFKKQQKEKDLLWI